MIIDEDEKDCDTSGRFLIAVKLNYIKPNARSFFSSNFYVFNKNKNTNERTNDGKFKTKFSFKIIIFSHLFFHFFLVLLFISANILLFYLPFIFHQKVIPVIRLRAKFTFYVFFQQSRQMLLLRICLDNAITESHVTRFIGSEHWCNL